MEILVCDCCGKWWEPVELWTPGGHVFCATCQLLDKIDLLPWVPVLHSSLGVVAMRLPFLRLWRCMPGTILLRATLDRACCPWRAMAWRIVQARFEKDRISLLVLLRMLALVE